jgi:hypothetical protein
LRLPILLRRIAGSLGVYVDIPNPIRVRRHRIVKPEELERAVELAARRAGPAGRILILLDADQDCPAELAPELLRRATDARSDRRIGVVLAKAEFESWFIAAADSLAGRQGIQDTAKAPANPESINDAKAWLSGHMPSGRSYRSTRDQPGLTKIFDLEAARAAPSFDKFWREGVRLLESDRTRE